MVKIAMTPEAAKQFEKLPPPIKTRMETIYGRLAQWPAVSGAKPLHGALAGHFRIRTGDYRIQFHLSGNTLIVERIGHRDGFYDE